MYEGLGTDPDPNVKILYIDVDLDARILKNNPDSNGRLPYTLIFPAKWILRLNWSLIFFLRIGGWFLGSLTTAKRTVGSKPSRLKAQVLSISNSCHWPRFDLQVEFVFLNPSYNDAEIDWDTALIKVKGQVF